MVHYRHLKTTPILPLYQYGIQIEFKAQFVASMLHERVRLYSKKTLESDHYCTMVRLYSLAVELLFNEYLPLSCQIFLHLISLN